MPLHILRAALLMVSSISLVSYAIAQEPRPGPRVHCRSRAEYGILEIAQTGGGTAFVFCSDSRPKGAPNPCSECDRSLRHVRP